MRGCGGGARRLCPWGAAGWLAAAAALAQGAGPPAWRPGGNPDPLRLASLRFETGDARELEAGRWALSASVQYVNLWSHTWHTVAYHREVGRRGLPLTSGELGQLAARYPGEAYQFLDLEGWWAEVWVQRGLPGGLTATLRLPYLEVGRPHWDAIAERWHRWLGLPDFARNEFPRGEALVYLQGPGGVVERRDLARSGLADVALAVAVPAGAWWGARHRAALAVEAPSGRRNTLHGSGGWDVGVRLFSRWEGRRLTALSGVGYTWPAPEGRLLGLRRSPVWHVMAGLEGRLGPALVASVRMQLEGALLAEAMGGAMAEATWTKRFGLAVPLRRGWVAFELGQDSFGVGVAPDYSFHLSLGSGPR